MKKFLFIAAIAALLMGTAVDASAKVKKTKKHKAQTTKSITSNNQKMKIDQGMYTAEEATRLENGDVADLEMAFLIGFYNEYVFNGNIYNKAYFPYVKTKFNENALNQLKDAEGNYDWKILSGRSDDSLGVTSENLNITKTGDKVFLVTDGANFKCQLKVEGPEGAYKITQIIK